LTSHFILKSIDAGIKDIIIGLIITGSAIISPLKIWNLGTFAALDKITAAFLAIITGVILLCVRLFAMYGLERE